MGNQVSKRPRIEDYLFDGGKVDLAYFLGSSSNEGKDEKVAYLKASWLKTCLDDEILGNIGQQNHRKEILSRRNFVERHTRDRGYACREMNALTDEQFRRMFRLNKAAFNHVLSLITPMIRWKTSPIGRGKYHTQLKPIPPKVKLAATLRWLAGGSYLDICFAFGISSSIFFHVKGGILWPTMEALDKVLKIDFPIDDKEQLEVISNGFAQCVGGEIKGVILAVDGWVCKTRAPSADEVPNPVSFRNRKGCFGVVVMAGCDARTKFRMVSCNFCGSTNDCLAWELTHLYSKIMAGLLPKCYFAIGDEIFNCNEFMLTPYGGRNIGAARDSFNYHLSRMRQCIERAFGILTRRWGIFWRPLNCDPTKWTLIIQVCAKLHNVCLDFKQSDDVIPTMPEDFDANDTAEVMMNLYNEENLGVLEIPSHNSSDRRKKITAWLDSRGLRRPLVNSQSRA